MQIGKLAEAGSVTHYVVQGYRKGARGKLRPDEPRIARDLNHCQVLAERVAQSRDAVIAFSRTGDIDTGDFDDPVIIATFGDVPEMS